MKMNGIHVWVASSLAAVGLGFAVSACSDSVASPRDNNLLNAPAGAKVAMGDLRTVVSGRTISQDATPVRELQDGFQDTAVAVPPKQFHEKIPNYSRNFWMTHDGVFTNYIDEDGTIWYHIEEGPWATYYSPDPAGPGPGEDFHEVYGLNATDWVEMWHITEGPYASKYFDPSGGGSVWEHDGKTTLYVPIQGYHIPDGPQATMYYVEPGPIDVANANKLR